VLLLSCLEAVLCCCLYKWYELLSSARLATSSIWGCNHAKHNTSTDMVLHVRGLLCHHLQGWGLHVWGSVAQPTPWSKPLPPSGLGPDGPYWDIQLTTAARHVGVLIHKGEEKAAGAPLLTPSSGRGIACSAAKQQTHAGSFQQVWKP